MTLDAVDVREGRVLRLLWELGLCEYDQLISWADALIARLEDPSYALTEISLAQAVEPSSRTFDALLGGKFSASETVVALARVNPDGIAIQRLCRALGTVADMAIGLEQDTSGRRSAAPGLLHDAFEVHDGHYYLERGEIGEAVLRRDASDYFRRIREAAAEADVTS